VSAQIASSSELRAAYVKGIANTQRVARKVILTVAEGVNPGDTERGVCARIDRELRTQYRLGYYPNPRGPANTYRSIEVKVLDNYKARHRKTYLTGPQ